MKVELTLHSCIVTREKGDPRFRSGGWGSDESQLLHHVKRELQKQGHDVIKKRMWKDGHMYGTEHTQYIRERKWKFSVYDGDSAIRNAAREFNVNGRVVFLVERGEAVKP